jgi:hypothetical protein
MLTESRSGWNKIVTPLKVAALVTMLGSVVLLAEQRIATPVAAGQPVAAETAPAPQAAIRDRAAQPGPTDYFPAHFSAPSGPVADQPPTF